MKKGVARHKVPYVSYNHAGGPNNGKTVKALRGITGERIGHDDPLKYHYYKNVGGGVLQYIGERWW